MLLGESPDILLTLIDLVQPYLGAHEDPNFTLYTLHITAEGLQEWVERSEVLIFGSESAYAHVLKTHAPHNGTYLINVRDSFARWQCHKCQKGVKLMSSRLSCPQRSCVYHRVCPICPKYGGIDVHDRHEPGRAGENEISRSNMEQAWNDSQMVSRRNTGTSRSEHFVSKRVSFVEGSRIPQRPRSNSPEVRAVGSSVTIGMDDAPWSPRSIPPWSVAALSHREPLSTQRTLSDQLDQTTHPHSDDSRNRRVSQYAPVSCGETK